MMKINLAVFLLLAFSCKRNEGLPPGPEPLRFNPESLVIKTNIREVRGQTWYIPVYSNIPYHEGDNSYNLSAFATVHNTDFHHAIRLTHVLYFNTEGLLVKDFLGKEPFLLKPLAATSFYIPERDQSGVGANFIIEWMADTLVSEPLIESVMVSLTSGQGVSFLSQGKVIREVTDMQQPVIIK